MINECLLVREHISITQLFNYESQTAIVIVCGFFASVFCLLTDRMTHTLIWCFRGFERLVSICVNAARRTLIYLSVGPHSDSLGPRLVNKIDGAGETKVGVGVPAKQLSVPTNALLCVINTCQCVSAGHRLNLPVHSSKSSTRRCHLRRALIHIH